MNRLKNVFAISTLLLAFPGWRSVDTLIVVSPFEWPISFALSLWFGFFILLPLKILFPNIKRLIFVAAFLFYGLAAWFTPPFSKMATDNPEFNHCSPLSFTGSFFPLRNLLSEAHADDLEIRNQMCWLRKMIARVPKFDHLHEMTFFSKLIREKLLKPEFKYRASLPLVALLEIRIMASSVEAVDPKWFQDSLNFWITQYTYEISERDYSWASWPHSSYIKWEYGLIEKNWQSLIESISVKN